MSRWPTHLFARVDIGSDRDDDLLVVVGSSDEEDMEEVTGGHTLHHDPQGLL